MASRAVRCLSSSLHFRRDKKIALEVGTIDVFVRFSYFFNKVRKQSGVSKMARMNWPASPGYCFCILPVANLQQFAEPRHRCFTSKRWNLDDLRINVEIAGSPFLAASGFLRFFRLLKAYFGDLR